MEEHRKMIMRAYQDATAILRKRYDSEFHEILVEIYKERNIQVRKRRSRLQKAQEQLEAARKVLDQINTD
jgi:hypothetical protein